jgi:hypothetical protein
LRQITGICSVTRTGLQHSTNSKSGAAVRRLLLLAPIYIASGGVAGAATRGGVHVQFEPPNGILDVTPGMVLGLRRRFYSLPSKPNGA